MSETSDQFSWLSVFPGLEGIKDKAWLETLKSASELRRPPRTVLIRKGDPCRNFLLVLSGSVRVYEVADNGREIVLYRVGAGELCVLTLTNLIEQTAYSAEAVTETEVAVISIPIQDFLKALAESAAFRAFIMATLARRLSNVMRLVEQIAFQRLDLRLACLLGQLFGKQNTSSLHVTHQDLARELGTTREVTSRLLKEFERMGCIRLGRSTIELISEDALARVAHNKSEEGARP